MTTDELKEFIETAIRTENSAWGRSNPDVVVEGISTLKSWLMENWEPIPGITELKEFIKRHKL